MGQECHQIYGVEKNHGSVLQKSKGNHYIQFKGIAFGFEALINYRCEKDIVSAHIIDIDSDDRASAISIYLQTLGYLKSAIGRPSRDLGKTSREEIKSLIKNGIWHEEDQYSTEWRSKTCMASLSIVKDIHTDTKKWRVKFFRFISLK